MDNSTHRVKKGDTAKILYFTLKAADPVTGQIVPYAIPNGSTVNLLMTPSNSTTLKVNAVCTILDQTTLPGQAKYQWLAVDVDTPGEYDIEFLVTLPDASKVRFPCKESESFGTVIVLSSKS